MNDNPANAIGRSIDKVVLALEGIKTISII